MVDYGFRLRRERCSWELYWVIVDEASSVGFIDHGGNRSGSDYLWEVNIPNLVMPSWCGGRCATFEDAKEQVKAAYSRLRPLLTDDQFDAAMWRTIRSTGQPPGSVDLPKTLIVDQDP